MGPGPPPATPSSHPSSTRPPTANRSRVRAGGQMSRRERRAGRRAVGTCIYSAPACGLGRKQAGWRGAGCCLWGGPPAWVWTPCIHMCTCTCRPPLRNATLLCVLPRVAPHPPGNRDTTLVANAACRPHGAPPAATTPVAALPAAQPSRTAIAIAAAPLAPLAALAALAAPAVAAPAVSLAGTVDIPSLAWAAGSGEPLMRSWQRRHERQVCLRYRPARLPMLTVCLMPPLLCSFPPPPPDGSFVDPSVS